MNRWQNKWFLILLVAISQMLFAEVKLPTLISDNMILQRNTELNIWGWADKGEKVSVSFIEDNYQTIADENGKWLVTIPAQKAGGPYVMTIAGSNIIMLKNIMIGEVWLASGQSNMELPMRRVQDKYADVIANCKNLNIRQFTIGTNYNFENELEDINNGKWVSADPESVLDFSAVAYFFARNLNEKYEVPVGIIRAAVGGSPAECWLSEDALKQFPNHYKILETYKHEGYADSIIASDRARQNTWWSEIDRLDAGLSGEKKWHETDIDDSDWKNFIIPGKWTDQGIEAFNGVVWFRREFELPEKFDGKAAKVMMGRIVDADHCWINGKKVGNITYQYPPRRYMVDEGILKAGKNTIVSRVINNENPGEFIKEKPYEVIFENDTLDLKGTWKYKIGLKYHRLEPQTFVRWKPTGLYNAMIAPTLNYKISGVVWYQGESNADDPNEYKNLFSALIADWRKNFDQGDFPFIYAQLPNFMMPHKDVTESNWAKMRDIQRRALEIPNTAMAIILDIGEWNDIHPLNKKTVGDRLAAGAGKLVFDEPGEYCGPLYKSMKIKKNKIILTFDHVGSGLIVKDGDELQHFSIAGENGKFVWAKAKIKKDKVIVWNQQVKNPKNVRYAWSDNPVKANLYNNEGFPASTFTTEEK